ncbi:SET domain-containing protein [Acidithiobacillus ferrivorans]|nr:SET domain-containing protein [Acidithiobacillus ferrivorans]
MRLLPFTSGDLFLPWALRAAQDAASDNHAEPLGDMLRLSTIAPGPKNKLQMPAIFSFFGLPTPHSFSETALELLEDIRMQVFGEMLALTGEEYRLDWSRTDGAFALWYRDRDARLDATRELTFVRANTVLNIKNTKISNSTVHGFGLFATQDIGTGKLLSVLDGQVFQCDDYEKLRQKLSYGLGRLRNHVFMEWNALPGDRLLARPLRTDYSYINHSLTPNLQVTASQDLHCQLELVTTRDIQHGEELFLDYNAEQLPRGYFDGAFSQYLR